MTAPMTDRTLPYPWGLCDVCGKAAGLPDPDRPAHLPPLYRCPACAAREALWEAARADLEALASPTVGAWAAQWSAAGLTPQQLEEVTEQLPAAWMAHDYGKAYRLAHLRRLRFAHRAPAFEVAGPDRVALDLGAFPRLTAYRPPDPARYGMEFAHFLDTAGAHHTLPRGLDTLALTLEGGARALIFTGHEGRSDFGHADRFRRFQAPGLYVPAHLWPTVAAVLEGSDPAHTLPEGGEA
ncbi:hypothetical protein [Deinococcus sp. DB0503]|uniref:hypothetical protein n=1 Tax=Deinococcus sp. DB0503 TaxID=2479203 RepID=UPI0018DFE8AD|nr:hypothetical protein [Deinococcus sp. DB0503]MBI0446298.1 hypothetical protein [Deinococcus sp. DB0503]